MRTAFFKAILDAANEDPRIYFVTGDLGFGVIEEIGAAHPGRVINAGVAEQAMTGLAAGLALSGAKVFTYSIANFPTLRCLEQIRNDIAYHCADVTVTAVGGGLAYGPLGISHHATEDIAMMRAIPNMRVAAPGDPTETRRVMEELIATQGPAYLRLGKAGEPIVHDECPPLPGGSSITLRNGFDCALLVTGAMLPVALEVHDRLSCQGITARLVSFPWIRPIDVAEIERAASECEALISIEEHSVIGGFGGAIAEIVSERRESAPLLRVGLPSTFTSVVGSQAYLRAVYGLSAEGIEEQVSKFLQKI